MAVIHLTTFIAAPVERVFDLSRSISLHKISTEHTHERVVDGKMTGLLDEGDTVTWQAKHLYKERRFTSRIGAMQRPDSFTDEMAKGDFKSFVHQHHFKQIDNGTIMIDILEFESPYGVIGKLFSRYYLKDYLKNLLVKRNEVIKQFAEGNRWKAILIN